jgi:hypothetical protein
MTIKTTITQLNHLGQPFKPATPSRKLSKFCRTFARRMWRESFGAKVIWRSSRQPGSDCSFRIFTGRCAA